MPLPYCCYFAVLCSISGDVWKLFEAEKEWRMPSNAHTLCTHLVRRALHRMCYGCWCCCCLFRCCRLNIAVDATRMREDPTTKTTATAVVAAPQTPTATSNAKWICTSFHSPVHSNVLLCRICWYQKMFAICFSVCECTFFPLWYYWLVYYVNCLSFEKIPPCERLASNASTKKVLFTHTHKLNKSDVSKSIDSLTREQDGERD